MKDMQSGIFGFLAAAIFVAFLAIFMVSWTDLYPGESKESKATVLALGLIICVCVLICYLPAINAPLVFDSKKLLTDRMFRDPQPLWVLVCPKAGTLCGVAVRP